MPFRPNSSDLSKKYPRNINYMPVVFFREIFDFEQVSEARDSEIAILGQAPRPCSTINKEKKKVLLTRRLDWPATMNYNFTVKVIQPGG